MLSTFQCSETLYSIMVSIVLCFCQDLHQWITQHPFVFQMLSLFIVLRPCFEGLLPAPVPSLQQYCSGARRSPKYAAPPFPSSFLLEQETFFSLSQCATVQTVLHSALGAKAGAPRSSIKWGLILVFVRAF